MIKLWSGRGGHFCYGGQSPQQPLNASLACLLSEKVSLWWQGRVSRRSHVLCCCQKCELLRVPPRAQSSASHLQVGVLVFEHLPQCSPRTAGARLFSSHSLPPGFLCECEDLCGCWWSNRKYFWLFSGVYDQGKPNKHPSLINVLGHFPLDGVNGSHFSFCQKCIRLMLAEQTLGVRRKS